MRPGFKTSEFIATLALAVALGASAIAGSLAPHYAAIASGIAVAGYAISRGLAKVNPPKG